MVKQFTIQTNNSKKTYMDISKLGSADLESYKIVLDEYSKNCQQECIFETGFNTNSGYVYIALENGIQIASCFGQSADFIVYDYETGEEYFYDTYEEAEQYLNNK